MVNCIDNPPAERKKMKYEITNIDEINNKKISDDIFDRELVDYKITDREDLIDHLIDWIGEAEGSHKELMKEDLKHLINLNDEYILSSVITNEYIVESEDKGQKILSDIYKLEKGGGTMNKYNVIWEEKHAVVVEARDESEAVEKVMEGQGSDDSVEISTPPEAYPQ